MPDARSPFRNQERKAVGDWWGWGSVSAKPCFLDFPSRSDHQANPHPIQPQAKVFHMPVRSRKLPTNPIPLPFSPGHYVLVLSRG